MGIGYMCYRWHTLDGFDGCSWSRKDSQWKKRQSSFGYGRHCVCKCTTHTSSSSSKAYNYLQKSWGMVVCPCAQLSGRQPISSQSLSVTATCRYTATDIIYEVQQNDLLPHCEHKYINVSCFIIYIFSLPALIFFFII